MTEFIFNTCPECNGPGYLLGRLGPLLHFRCRSCELEFINQEDHTSNYAPKNANTPMLLSLDELCTNCQYLEDLGHKGSDHIRGLCTLGWPGVFSEETVTCDRYRSHERIKPGPYTTQDLIDQTKKLLDWFKQAEWYSDVDGDGCIYFETQGKPTPGEPDDLISDLKDIIDQLESEL